MATITKNNSTKIERRATAASNGRLMPFGEVAAMFQCSIATVRRLVKVGKLVGVSLTGGKPTRCTEASVLSFINGAR